MTEHSERFRRLITWLATGTVILAAIGCNSSTSTTPAVVSRPKSKETPRPRIESISKPAADSVPEDASDPLAISKSDESGGSRNSTSPRGQADAAPAVLSRPSFRVLTDPRPLHEPQVVLSRSHRDTCLVHVGDAFPELDLADSAGTQREWRNLLGPNLTIVVLWSTQWVFAVEQVNRLEMETVDLFAGAGVNVVTLNVGDTPQTLAEWSQGTPPTAGAIVHLADPKREAFAKIATSRFPRTYLLDSSGRIVWMDIEYSQTTTRDLENAVRYYLKRPPSRAANRTLMTGA